MNVNYKLLNFNEIGDEKGKLVAIENLKNIPFEIKRIFYIYNTDKDVIRGQHSNKISRFVLISISGSCKVKVLNSGREEIFKLNSPNKGLFIDRLVWKEMYDFSEDNVLLVLSDSEYKKDEYIYEK